MKKFLIAIVALVTLGNFSASAQKIAHLNYQDVMDTLSTYKKAVELNTEYETAAQESAQFLQEKMQKKYQEYEQGTQNGMSKIELMILEDEINNLQQRLQEVQVSYQNNMKIIEDRYLVKIDGWLKASVDIVGKNKGLDYILYYSEDGSIFWVNSSKGVDVTNEVITEMLKQEKANPVVVPGG